MLLTLPSYAAIGWNIGKRIKISSCCRALELEPLIRTLSKLERLCECRQLWPLSILWVSEDICSTFWSTLLTDSLSRALPTLGGASDYRREESKWSRPKLIGPMKPLFWPPFWSSDSDSNFNSSPFNSSSKKIENNACFTRVLARPYIVKCLQKEKIS